VEAALKAAPLAFSKDVRSVLAMAPDWQYAAATQVEEEVWRPIERAVLIVGDLDVAGNIVVRTQARADDTFLVVLGSVRCKNLVLGARSTFLCSGDVEVDEVMCCTAGDSVSKVAGRVSVRVLDSGSGAWLSIYDPLQLVADSLTGYVMVGNLPVKPSARVDLSRLVVPAVIERDEWDSLDPEDQADEDPADYLRIDDGRLRTLLGEGRSVLLP
jgi:hypothetical protein